MAVPTRGGLVTTAAADHLTVVVGAYEGLTRSPVLSGDGRAGHWITGQLPAAVSNARAAVSAVGRRTTVVLSTDRGTAVTWSGRQWVEVAEATELAGADGVVLDGVTWASSQVGWLTAHGRDGASMAFQTRDAGHTWAPLQASTGSAVAALAPCGAGTRWLLPLLADNGTLRILHTADGGQEWTAGASVPQARGLPAWGCLGDEVWVASRKGSHDHVLASSDAGRTWADAGAAPDNLSDLEPIGGGRGYATSTSGKGPALWSVSGNGALFASIQLPAWVATLGGQTGDN